MVLTHEHPTTVYCDSKHHVTVTVPQNLYDYAAYTLAVASCDCPIIIPDTEP